MRNPLTPLLNRYQALSRGRQRLVWLGGALLCGLTLVPLLIFAAGRSTLGAYGNGGWFAMWGDFFRGLGDLNPAYWFAAAGPLLLLLAYVFWRRVVKI